MSCVSRLALLCVSSSDILVTLSNILLPLSLFSSFSNSESTRLYSTWVSFFENDFYIYKCKQKVFYQYIENII